MTNARCGYLFRTKSPLLWPKSLLNSLIVGVFQYLSFLLIAFKVKNWYVSVLDSPVSIQIVTTVTNYTTKMSCSTMAVWPTQYSKEMMIQESYDEPIEKTNGKASFWVIEHFTFIAGSHLNCLWFSEKRMSGFHGCNGLQ